MSSVLVGSRLVVWGGELVDEPGNAADGGLVFDVNSGTWSPVTGDGTEASGLVGGSGVSTSTTAYFLGTRCTVFYPVSQTSEEDVEPCLGQPLDFISVDAESATARRLPLPDLPKEFEIPYLNTSVLGIGVHGSLAVFQLRNRDAKVLEAYDIETGDWKRLPTPPPELEPEFQDINGLLSIAEIGGALMVFAGQGSGSLSVEPSSVRSWRLDDDTSRWEPTAKLVLLKDAYQLRVRARHGVAVVLGIRPLDGPRSVARFDPDSNSWTTLPDLPPDFDVYTGTPLRQGSSLIFWGGDADGRVASVNGDGSGWDFTPKPESSIPADFIDSVLSVGDGRLVLIPTTLQGEESPTTETGRTVGVVGVDATR